MDQYVKMLEAQLNATAKKVEKFLIERYHYFEAAYMKYQEAHDAYEQALEDKQCYDMQLKVGLISQHEH